MGYIFTEYFFDFFKIYVNISILLTNIVLLILTLIIYISPYIVKYIIGYCHFYYQLGYGLIFYIYIYRRYNSKKYSDWSSFYGNSNSNWVLFNISVLNKFIFSINFITLIKTIITKSYVILKFWANEFIIDTAMFTKLKIVFNSNYNKIVLYNWTPLFKRTSYISFFSFLKRFSKRK